MPRVSCAALLLALAAAPCAADESSDMLLPESQKDIAVKLCSSDDANSPACTSPSLKSLSREVDDAATAAIAKADAKAAVLLKRDQVWFGEVAALYAQNQDRRAGQEVWDKLAATLKRRRADLGEIAQGLGRAAIAGKWTNAFGTVDIAPGAAGAFQVTMAAETSYGPEDEQQQGCKASIAIRPAADGWFAGDTEASAATVNGKEASSRLRLRLQGETLRVLAGDDVNVQDNEGKFGCRGINQITGSYFPLGKTAADTRGGAPFTAPTFDCARPATASEEEICADPDLAANDRRINRAWKALLPRLAPATRALLRDDQRAWVTTQAIRYPDQLHPPSAKLSYFVHYTANARDNLAAIQRERLTLLESYDLERRGFEGDWSAYNATITVSRNKNGTLNVAGNKWFEDDYKGGCDYDFNGTARGETFAPADTSKNPDSVALDRGTLIVNPADDAWVKRRQAGASPEPGPVEGKCRRSTLISSTARLFPVRPKPPK